MSTGYLLRRLLWAIPTLFGVAVVVFVLMRVVRERRGPARA